MQPGQVVQTLASGNGKNRGAKSDDDIVSYLTQARLEQHNIIYLNYKQLQQVPRELVINTDFTCVLQLYLRNNCIESLVSGTKLSVLSITRCKVEKLFELSAKYVGVFFFFCF